MLQRVNESSGHVILHAHAKKKMISTLGELFNLNHFDQSSRANDVIVVRHRDGSLHSSPFTVRFGRAKMWDSLNKVVQVEVNGVLTSAVMKIGKGGEAYWLQPTYGHFQTALAAATAGGTAHQPAVAPHAAVDFAFTLESPAELSENGAITPEMAARAQPVGEFEKSFRHHRTEETPAAEPTLPPACFPSLASPSSGISELRDEPPFLQDAAGHLVVAHDQIHTAGDAQQANFALQALAAAEKSRQRLSLFMIQNPYWGEVAEAAEAEEVCRTTHLEEAHSPSEHALTPVTVTQPKADGTITETGPTPQAPTRLTHAAAVTVDRKDSLGRSPLSSAADDDDGDEYFLDPIDGDYYDGGKREGPLLDSEVDGMVNRNSDAFNKSFASSGKGENRTMTSPPGATVLPATEDAAGPPLDGYDAEVTALAGEMYFTATQIPATEDLSKLHLQEGLNQVRFLARKNFGDKEAVVVSCCIFLYNHWEKIVVSDVDGTITKSDLWGHFYQAIGKGGNWTHPGICSLYSKLSANGYKVLYLTARSVTQIVATKRYLWNLEQDGVRLPIGPVLTVPHRFFTALTQEVSKQSHVFKIACLSSVRAAFPPGTRPFFAGFGNRVNDAISYDAVDIPMHRIFIIDPTSVLHVCQVKHTYRNLAHLVDVTFPPLTRRRHDGRDARTAAPFLRAAPLGSVWSSDDEVGSTDSGRRTAEENAGATVGRKDTDNAHGKVAIADTTHQPEVCLSATFSLLNNNLTDAICVPTASTGAVRAAAPAVPSSMEAILHHSIGEEVYTDPDYSSYNYWRMDPRELIEPLSTKTATMDTVAPAPSGEEDKVGSSTAADRYKQCGPERAIGSQRLERPPVPLPVSGPRSQPSVPVGTSGGAAGQLPPSSMQEFPESKGRRFLRFMRGGKREAEAVLRPLPYYEHPAYRNYAVGPVLLQPSPPLPGPGPEPSSSVGQHPTPTGASPRPLDTGRSSTKETSWSFWKREKGAPPSATPSRSTTHSPSSVPLEAPQLSSLSASGPVSTVDGGHPR